MHSLYTEWLPWRHAMCRMAVIHMCVYASCFVLIVTPFGRVTISLLIGCIVNIVLSEIVLTEWYVRAVVHICSRCQSRYVLI